MRLSRHNMFMDIAHTVAKRGTCPRMCVGAVVVVNNRQLYIGYNGAPSGSSHCTDVGCLIVPGSNGCQRTNHAETNALDSTPLTNEKKVLYVTLSPCMECAIEVVKRGVAEVYFAEAYRDKMPILHLMDVGIPIHRVLPNGYIINGQTGNLLEVD